MVPPEVGNPPGRADTNGMPQKPASPVNSGNAPAHTDGRIPVPDDHGNPATEPKQKDTKTSDEKKDKQIKSDE